MTNSNEIQKKFVAEIHCDNCGNDTWQWAGFNEEAFENFKKLYSGHMTGHWCFACGTHGARFTRMSEAPKDFHSDTIRIENDKKLSNALSIMGRFE